MEFNKVCKICGKEFVSTARNTKYCSSECAEKGKKKVNARTRRRRLKRQEYDSNKDAMRLISSAYSLAKRVAEVFQIPKVCVCQSSECQGDLELNHKDVNIFNNSPDNLEYRCKKHHTQYHLQVPDVNMLKVIQECQSEEDYEIKMIVFDEKVKSIDLRSVEHED